MSTTGMLQHQPTVLNKGQILKKQTEIRIAGFRYALQFIPVRLKVVGWNKEGLQRVVLGKRLLQ